MNIAWLAADEPDTARQEIIEALQEWPHKGFHLQHYSSLFALSQIMLYTGDGPVAWKHTNELWQELEKSMLLRIQMLRIEAQHLLARSALAAAGRGVDVKSLLRTAERAAKQIAKERMPWSDPFVPLILAGATSLRGDKEKAARLLSAAVRDFDAADMRLYAMVARRRLGQLVGGEEGNRMITAADEWMRRQRIEKPELMTRTLAPGFIDDLDN